MADKLTLDDLTGFRDLEEFGPAPTEVRLETALNQLPAPEYAEQAKKLPGALPLGAMTTITKARMRNQVANLFSQEVPHIQAALAELRKENPKVYIDQILAIAEFAIPRLKSVEVSGESEAGRKANEMTLDELMGALNDDNVVSVQ